MAKTSAVPRINQSLKPVAYSEVWVKLKTSLMIMIVANVPTIKISELAKLIIRRTP